jgi:amino acid transporter
MFEPMIARTKYAAGTAGIGAFATIALCVGLVFWTMAAWIFLATVVSTLAAALILGSFYTGAAFLGFAVMSARKRRVIAHRPPRPLTTESIIAAFISGIKAGASTRR